MPVTRCAAVLAALLVVGCGGATSSTRQPIAWERIDPSPASDKGPTEIVAWSGGYVGVGSGSSWVSADGRTWQATAFPDAGDGGATGLVAVDGQLVAVGSVYSSQSPLSTRATAWTSIDGVEWQRIPDDADLQPAPGFAQTQLSAVTAGPAGLVAAGVEWGDRGQHPEVWRSADGRDWVRATTSPDGSGTRDVLATADGYVLAAADNARAGEATRATFWFSIDGLEWTAAPEIPSFGNAEPQSLAMRDGTIVAVGYRATSSGLAPAAWISTDGRAWAPVPDTPALAWWPFPGPTPVGGQGALQGTAMTGVHTGWSGFIAVGSSWGLDPSKPQPDGSFAPMIRADVWRSADGRAWELLTDELLSVSEPGMSNVRYGFGRVGELGGRPLIVGATPELGVTLWLGPAAIE